MTIPIQTLIDVIDSKPEGWYARITQAGRVHQGILHISHEDWQRFQNRPVTFAGIRHRTDQEKAAILKICEPCDNNVDGRCKLCRVCGGLRKIEDWADLSSHHCKDGLW